MSDVTTEETEPADTPPPETEEVEDFVEVRRDGPLSAVVGLVAAGFAIAYMGRAAGTGAWLDWLLFVVLTGIAAVHLAALLDARAPLLLADRHGIRMREGRSWRGVAWPEVERVEHVARQGLLRDGRVLVAAAHDRELTVRLSMATRLIGADWDELTDTLRDLAEGRTEIVEALPAEESAAKPAAEPAAERDLDAPAPPSRAARPTSEEKAGPVEPAVDQPERRLEPAQRGRSADSGPLRADDTPSRPGPAGEPVPVPTMRASRTPSPLRKLVVAARAQIHHDDEHHTDGATALQPDPAETPEEQHLPEARELRRHDEVEDTVVFGDRISPIAKPGDAVETIVIDDFVVEPATDPVIGPEIAAARTRLGLDVDLLAERTRIRPHVIESIEVDDFAPCGGDFYARGHLRTLARVLGIDAAPLLEKYDDRYADAPIDPRRVFEAELATGEGGSIRGTRGGLNWSVLIAAVMAAVLVWSIARLVMDGPVEIDRAPVLNGSPSNVQQGPGAPAPVPVTLTAEGGGAKVMVRDGTGRIVFDGELAFGQTTELEVSPPVRVWTSDGSVTASIDGEDRGALGETGQEAQGTYVVR